MADEDRVIELILRPTRDGLNVIINQVEKAARANASDQPPDDDKHHRAHERLDSNQIDGIVDIGDSETRGGPIPLKRGRHRIKWQPSDTTGASRPSWPYYPLGPDVERISAPYRVGMWLPSDMDTLGSWMGSLFNYVVSIPFFRKAVEMILNSSCDELTCDFPGMLPPVCDLRHLIENDAVVNKFFHQMLSQARLPENAERNRDNYDQQVPDQVFKYCTMLFMINTVIQQAPEYSYKTGVVGVPLTAILAWCMGTTAGSAVFLNEKVNKVFKKILTYWGKYLKSEASKVVLNKDPDKGWFCERAMEEMSGFVDTFKCDPNDPHFGFNSWDDFFTRELKEGARPIASPHDDSVIVNACESVPYKLRKNIQRQSRFWIKSQPYSLLFMLANDPLIEQFVGGTVYQAFLSSRSYHRWHSPVNGKIVKAYVVDGSYYAELEFDSFDDGVLPLQNESQAYLTEIATRALVFIQADNPNIGLMCFMAVGMVEVSSCDITVYEGQRVKKGQQLGMFHYGGSTHCLIFRPGVELYFEPEKHGIRYPGIIPNIPGYTGPPFHYGWDFHSLDMLHDSKNEPDLYTHILFVNSKIATVLPNDRHTTDPWNKSL